MPKRRQALAHRRAAGDGLVLKGHVRIESYPAGAHEQAGNSPLAPRAALLLPTAYRLPPIAYYEADNVACTVGVTALLHWLASDGVAQGGLSYIAVGTGTATPAATDTQLGTELARIGLTLGAVVGASVTAQAFFTALQANGTWTEVGVFGNGATDAANSGTLFGHALLSYTKTTSLETIVAYTLTVS